VTAAHNMTSDMTTEEFENYTSRGNFSDQAPGSLSYADPSGLTISADYEIDHVGAGFTTGVRNQGNCNASYAHTATTVLETALAL